MARVTRSSKSKEVAEPETVIATPKLQTADIPIRSIENHDASSKEAVEKEPVNKTPSSKDLKKQRRRKEYKKKKRQELIATIKASDNTPADKNALKAKVYRSFRTKADSERKVVELQKLTEAQKNEIEELKKQLAEKQPSTPKTRGVRKRRGGFI